MTSNEIQSQAILGSHTQIKAFLGPIMHRIEAVTGPLTASYSGTGKIMVTFEASDFRSSKACWDHAWKMAREVAKAFPELRVSKPARGGVDGGTFQIIRDSFLVAVR